MPFTAAKLGAVHGSVIMVAVVGSWSVVGSLRLDSLYGAFFVKKFQQSGSIFFPSSVSLFDLKARFFVPTRHGGTMRIQSGWVSKMTIRGEPAFERGSIAPQPCIRWVQGPEP